MVARLILHGLVLVTEDEEVDAWVMGGFLLSILEKACFGDIVVIASLHFVLEFL